MGITAFIDRSEDRHNVKARLGCVTAGRIAFKSDTNHANATSRPHGFADFQLIYIRRGYGLFDGKKVGAGTAVLFYPHEPQYYLYPEGQTLEVYWLHFGGCEAKALLEDLGIYGLHRINIAADDGIVESIRTIIREGNAQLEFMKQRCVSHLIWLLTELARNVNNHTLGIECAIQKINTDFASDFSNTELAQMCGLSVSHFLRKFRAHTGKTPHAYKTEQRLLVAKELLLDGGYTVKQTAKTVGFDDQLYFSRFFKKHTGLTPSEYRDIV